MAAVSGLKKIIATAEKKNIDNLYIYVRHGIVYCYHTAEGIKSKLNEINQPGIADLGIEMEQAFQDVPEELRNHYKERLRLNAWIEGYERCLKDHKQALEKPPVVDLREQIKPAPTPPQPSPYQTIPSPYQPYPIQPFGYGIPTVPTPFGTPPLTPTPGGLPLAPSPFVPPTVPPLTPAPTPTPSPAPTPPLVPPYHPRPFGDPPSKPFFPKPWDIPPKRRIRCPR